MGFVGEPRSVTLVRAREDFETLNRSLKNPVDPDTQLVLIAPMGGQPNGGVSIHIARVVETNDALWAEVVQVGPAEDCNVTMAATFPMALAAIPRSEKPVHFVVRPLELRSCNQP